MSWRQWADELRAVPSQAVADLLRGAADISPFERVEAHEFLLAVLPRGARVQQRAPLGHPSDDILETDADLLSFLDSGLKAWFLEQRDGLPPVARRLSAYAARVCAALQWPMYFDLPQTRAVLAADRAVWLRWLASLTVSVYRDPEYDYWQVLASVQADDRLQFFWQSFVVEAGRTRSARYLNLGLLALAKLPLSQEDSLRNLRLQAQALLNRYKTRQAWGAPAQEELAQGLRGVMARNPSLSAGNYQEFLRGLLEPLGQDKMLSILSLLGFVPSQPGRSGNNYKRPEPPGLADDTDQAVERVRKSPSLLQAWDEVRPLLSVHEAYVHKSGDAYYFVRNLDRCGRALCNKYEIREPEVRDSLLQWVRLALCLDAEDQRLWMLWQLVLRKSGYARRAQWVLWEMTRRFPDHLPCRVELARLLAESAIENDWAQAQRLLRQVLKMDTNNLYAYSTLAQLAIRREDWAQALDYARQGLQIDESDGSSAVLLATALSRRNEAGDLQRAIEGLQRFVDRFSGQLNPEGYLRKLLKRQELLEQGQFLPFEDDVEGQHAAAVQPEETNAAWLAFAESVRGVADDSAVAELAQPNNQVSRVLPLPQFLRLAVERGEWGSDPLLHYDEAAKREFALEIGLWRYLQVIQSPISSAADQERAREAVQAWIDKEQRTHGEKKSASAELNAASQEKNSWITYLSHEWLELNAASEDRLATGAAWLKDLLARYQPLPAPVLAAV